MSTASHYQHKSSLSNWFSSLKRQPKNKPKPSLNSIDKKLQQRSCVDLSSTIVNGIGPVLTSSSSGSSSTSTFYVETPYLSAKKKQNTGSPYYCNSSPSNDGFEGEDGNNDEFNSREKGLNGRPYDEEDDDDRKGLLNGKNVRQFCTQYCCCCQKPFSSSSGTKSLSFSPPFIASISSNSSSNNGGGSTSKNSSHPYIKKSEKNECKIETDFTTDIRVTKCPTSSGDNRSYSESDDDSSKRKEGNFMIYNKKSQFIKKTTTTITRTIISTRPIVNRVGLVFNDDGELITKLDKIRANSVDSILNGVNESGDLIYKRERIESPPNETGRDGKRSILDGDFLYIDDSSATSFNDFNENNCDKKLILCDDCKFSSTNNSTNPSSTDSNCTLTANNKKSQQHGKNAINKKSANYISSKKSPNISWSSTWPKKQLKDEICEIVSEMEALDSQEDSKHSNKDKQMSIGRKKFNMDPKKGIEYLVDNHLLRMDPQDIAHFLYKGEGLNKTAIGDYLGEKNDFNEQVLKAFVELHDFTNLILVQALRQFLWSFRLPGEAQKIDRMMECFAQRYCQLNPDIFTNTDTCYVLSFAIIMLNTSLHNPSVKEKPTVEQFISMNRGINNGGDLPRGLLESLYESIRTEPFKIPQDDGNDLMHTFFNPDKEGWLWKQGGRYKSWKRRWFILNDNCLYYFEYTTDKEPRGIIPLENISVREIQDRSKPHCFELYASGGADIIKACKTDSEGKVVEGKHTVYRMSAATEEDKQEWIKRLSQSISHNPFYDILVQRKKKALAKS